MDKKSHLKIANVTFDYLFAKKGLLKRLAYLYGSIEPDINVMTYLAGHGDERVRPYILKKLASLREYLFASVFFVSTDIFTPHVILLYYKNFLSYNITSWIKF